MKGVKILLHSMKVEIEVEVAVFAPLGYTLWCFGDVADVREFFNLSSFVRLLFILGSSWSPRLAGIGHGALFRR